MISAFYIYYVYAGVRCSGYKIHNCEVDVRLNPALTLEYCIGSACGTATKNKVLIVTIPRYENYFPCQEGNSYIGVLVNWYY